MVTKNEGGREGARKSASVALWRSRFILNLNVVGAQDLYKIAQDL